MNNDENITIRDIKENIFYVHKLSTTLMDDNSQEKAVRKVRVGIMDNINMYFYRRLLACIIILHHSREFQEKHSGIFEEIIKELDYPDITNNLKSIDDYINSKSIDDYINSNRRKLDAIDISSKPVTYLLFFLISFYNLNDLLRDFHTIFNRTLSYEKQVFDPQNWDSLIKDDFLFSMLIFGLDELELSGTSEEYFESLQNRYVEKQKFYHQEIKSNNLKVTSKLYRSIDADIFLIEDRTILKENELFTYLKKMKSKEERSEAEALRLSLFVFQVSPEFYQKIKEITIQGEDFSSDDEKSLCKALKKSRRAGLNDLSEYQKIQSLEKIYRYIDEDIATTFADKDISCKLKPFFQIT